MFRIPSIKLTACNKTIETSKYRIHYQRPCQCVFLFIIMELYLSFGGFIVNIYKIWMASLLSVNSARAAAKETTRWRDLVNISMPKKYKAFRFGLFSLLTKHRKETLSGYLRYNQYSRIHHLIARKNSFFNASGQLAPPS